MRTKDRWQQGIAIAELAIVIAGILMYSQVYGFARPWHFLGFLTGFAGVAVWLRLSRAKLRRQLAVMLVLVTYAFFMPMLMSGEISGRVFVLACMLPITVVGSALYFGAFRWWPRKRPVGPAP